MARRSVLGLVVSSLLASPAAVGAAPGPPAPAPADPASGPWVEQVTEQIRRGEYQLSPSPGGDGWTAPNRAHDLRSTWREGRLEMRPRVESDAWTFHYELRSVGRPGAEAQAAPAASEWMDAGRLEWTRGDVREWYVNDDRGVEQGFVLERRPGGEDEAAADQPVVIDGAIEGLLAYPSEDAGSVLLRTSEGKEALRIRDLKATDARGRELATCFAVGEGVLRIVVDDSGAVYPVTVDPLFASPAWTAESNQANAYYGWSVATAGDVNGDGYSDVIVGAFVYDNGETDEGRAFVYHGSAAGLAATPAWTAEGNQAYAIFGGSVATAGDVNGDGYSDVIVGAFFYDNGENEEGRAFVYHGSASGLATTAAWTAEGNQVASEFGFSVATAGDVDGDGYGDVIVGAPGYSNGETQEGGAYVYRGSASGLGGTAAWHAESNLNGAQFGSAVAAAGDVNGDGHGDVIVGASGYSNGETQEGGAFVYLGSAAGPAASPAWTAEGNQLGAQLGWSVATAGDVNGDGYSDVIVGAYLFSNGESNEGRAFVYHGSASGLSASAAWTVESNQGNGRLGSSVATAGDVNGDGYSDVIVGAYWYSNGESFEGRAFVYQGSASGLAATPAWTAEGNQASSNFGISVAAAGDVDGDGYGDVIVGAPRYGNGESNEGRAYVYHGSAMGLAATAGWTDEGNQAGAELGVSVATAGDVNGDGYSDVIAGAFGYDAGQADAGRALVYLGSASGPSIAAAWAAEGDQVSAFLGYAVGTAGDVNGDGYSDVVVGAPGYDNGESDEGRAYVYLGSPAGPAATASWTAEGNQAGASFGSSVATAGDVNGDGFSDVIVGAPDYDNVEADEGRVFVYHGSASGLGAAAAATREPNQAGAHFGWSVGSAGDVNRDTYGDVIVGAPYFDNGQTDEGRAYVYHGSSTGIAALPARTLEPNQATANFGWSVGTAGDVGGDGYSDVIVGAPQFSYGELNEGRVFVYHGSAAGIPATAAWKAESNQAGAKFGSSVGTAGDVNGDGYSDIVIGAYLYDNGESDEGRAFVYHGSASGLATTPAWTAEGNQTNAYFGSSVASAGDVNGDGFADVIVGAFAMDNGQGDEGKAFLYYGNGGKGLDRIARVSRLGGSPPIDLLSRTSQYSFGVEAKGRTPFGRGRVRLEVEVKGLSTPFNGSGLQSTGYSLTGAPGAEGSVLPLELDLAPPLPSGMLRWRARLRTLAPFPWVSPWLSQPRNARTEGDLRILPTDLVVTAVSAAATSGAGKPLPVTDTTQNNGSGTTPPTTTKVWLSLDTVLDPSVDTLIGSRSVPSLATATASTGAAATTVPSGWPTGTSYLIAQADGDFMVQESSETNNLKSSSIKIGPDLSVSLLGAPTSAARGASILVTDTTKNLGGGDAPASTTGFYLSTDNVFDDGDGPLGSRAVPLLGPLATGAGSTSVTIPVWTAPGSYFIIAVSDDRQLILETLETNNTRSKAIAIN